MVTRRTILTSAAGLTVGACVRRKASGYPGFAFIANQEGEAVAAVDLAVFAVARHIRVQGRPTDVVAHPTLPLVYALTPENGTLHEIRADTLAFSRRITVASSAVSLRMSPDGEYLYLLCREPRCLIRFSTAAFRPERKIGLPAYPVDFDLDPQGDLIAVSYGTKPFLSLFEANSHNSSMPIPAAGETGAVRFQSDSRALIAANLSQRMLAFYQVASRRLIVNLPLSVRPEHLCFKADGGELFVTGQGMDGVVVVSPFYTPYVAETVLAGHSPGAMAASVSRSANPQYLFIANPPSGDVSVLDIEKRRVVAVTPVGSDPNYITITPDDRYALVLNRTSGDLGVIRVANITRASTELKKWRKGPLFMLVPVGSKPVSAAIVTI